MRQFVYQTEYLLHEILLDDGTPTKVRVVQWNLYQYGGWIYNSAAIYARTFHSAEGLYSQGALSGVSR
jgi:hypothetical protein